LIERGATTASRSSPDGFDSEACRDAVRHRDSSPISVGAVTKKAHLTHRDLFFPVNLTQAAKEHRITE
jgi:hypothetical protein